MEFGRRLYDLLLQSQSGQFQMYFCFLPIVALLVGKGQSTAPISCWVCGCPPKVFSCYFYSNSVTQSWILYKRTVISPVGFADVPPRYFPEQPGTFIQSPNPESFKMESDISHDLGSVRRGFLGGWVQWELHRSLIFFLTVFDQNFETNLPVLGVDDLGSIMRWHRDSIKAFVQEMGPSEIKIAPFTYIFLQYVEIWTKRKKNKTIRQCLRGTIRKQLVIFRSLSIKSL